MSTIKPTVPMLLALTIVALVLALGVLRRDLDRTQPSSELAEVPGDREPGTEQRDEPAERTAGEGGVVGLDHDQAMRTMLQPGSYGPATGSSPTIFGDGEGSPPERMASRKECTEMMAHMRTALMPTRKVRGAPQPPPLETIERRERSICRKVQFPRKMTRCVLAATTAEAIAACRKTKLPAPDKDAPGVDELYRVAGEIGVEMPRMPSERQTARWLEKVQQPGEDMELLDDEPAADGDSAGPERADDF